jgi:hypothetical protein
MSAEKAPVVTFTPCFDNITTTDAKPIKLKDGDIQAYPTVQIGTECR